MRYVGGKSKLARELSKVMLSISDGRDLYLEPFLGGASVFSEMAPHFQYSIGSDLSEDLVMMWDALYKGWTPPEEISEDDYANLKSSAPSPLRGLVGFGSSFGGKWFGGYARGGFTSSGDPRDYYKESRRSVLRTVAKLDRVRLDFENKDYRDYSVTNCIVYADPPYADTQGYDNVEAFSTDEFWVTMSEWSERGNTVFVSEYTAPPGWEPVWTKTHRQYLSKSSTTRETRTEKLFMLRT